MTEAELEALCWGVMARWPTLTGGALFDRAHHEIRYPLPPWAKAGHGQVPQKRLRACLDRLAHVNPLQAHLELFLARLEVNIRQFTVEGQKLPALEERVAEVKQDIREVYEGMIAGPVARNQIQEDDDFYRMMGVSEGVFIRGESIREDWPEAIKTAIERLRLVPGVPQERFYELFFGHGVQFQPPIPCEPEEGDPQVKQRTVET